MPDIAATGRIITGAALIIVVVFTGFAAGQLVMFQQLGFGVGVALLVDATLIRMGVVPAAMPLLGRWNWYLPSWLNWMPELYVEGDPSPFLPSPGSPRPSLCRSRWGRLICVSDRSGGRCAAGAGLNLRPLGYRPRDQSNAVPTVARRSLRFRYVANKRAWSAARTHLWPQSRPHGGHEPGHSWRSGRETGRHS